MKTEITPTVLLWRGEYFLVENCVEGLEPQVMVRPENDELRKACLRNMQANAGHLTLGFVLGRYFLSDDLQKGR